MLFKKKEKAPKEKTPKENRGTTKKDSKKKGATGIPRTVTDSIPYIDVYPNGLIQIRQGVFSKSYWIPDVSFKTAANKTQWDIATAWSNFLCAFESSVTVEVTLYNRTIDMESFQEDVFLKMKGDSLNRFRAEYNEMLMEKMAGAKNNLITEKIMTVSLEAENVLVAVEKFDQIDILIREHMTLIAKKDADAMDIMERLEMLNAIYNQDSTHPLYEKRKVDGQEVESFSLENCVTQGITTKDVIAPPSFEFYTNYAKVGDAYTKSYHISNYPTWIRGTLLTSFAEIPANMLVSVYYNIMDQEESYKMLKRQNTNISSELVEIQKRAYKSGFRDTFISPETHNAKTEVDELMQGMVKDNARLFTVNFIITLFASSETDLKKYESQLRLVASKNMVSVKPLNLQQEAGLASALPLGNNRIHIQRLMSNNTVASIQPFSVKEIRQKTGMYYGLNASSQNMILYDRSTGPNYNSCILGMPGAGKSFAAKREIINVLLNTDDEVYIIDPEGEYRPLTERLGGSCIRIANGSDIHINPFDLNVDNIDDNQKDPIKIKADFIQTIMEIMLGGRYGLGTVEQSLIDRCVFEVYEPYMKYLKKTGKTIDIQHAPTMQDFYNSLCKQNVPEAYNLALSLERYVKGGQDVFSHATNVDVDNRFVVYDIKDIGGGLKELGLQICLDNIWNKMIENKAKGKRTWIYIDEFYLLMQKENSAKYIAEIWKRARKWNGFPCAITQNVEDLLKSESARTVLNNCHFMILLGQTPINLQQLSDMLNITPAEQKYISSPKPGMGIIRIGSDVIPMDDSFPQDTELYHIMTTKPTDVA